MFFRYRCFDAKGGEREGTITASSLQEAASFLHRRNLRVKDLTEERYSETAFMPRESAPNAFAQN